jgi:hypothetical protein
MIRRNIMAWSKSLVEKTMEMIENMDANGAFFKNIDGKRGMFFQTEKGFKITLFEETTKAFFLPSLSEEVYYFNDEYEVINAGWVVD